MRHFEPDRSNRDGAVGLWLSLRVRWGAAVQHHHPADLLRRLGGEHEDALSPPHSPKQDTGGGSGAGGGVPARPESGKWPPFSERVDLVPCKSTTKTVRHFLRTI